MLSINKSHQTAIFWGVQFFGMFTEPTKTWFMGLPSILLPGISWSKPAHAHSPMRRQNVCGALTSMVSECAWCNIPQDSHIPWESPIFRGKTCLPSPICKGVSWGHVADFCVSIWSVEWQHWRHHPWVDGGMFPAFESWKCMKCPPVAHDKAFVAHGVLQVRLHNVLGGSRVRPTMAYFKSIKTTHKMGEHSTDFLMRLLHFVAMFCESFPKHTVVYGKMHTHTGVSLWHLMSFPYPFSAYRKANSTKPVQVCGVAFDPHLEMVRLVSPCLSLSSLCKPYSIQSRITILAGVNSWASSLAGLAVQDLHGACAYKASSGMCSATSYFIYFMDRNDAQRMWPLPSHISKQDGKPQFTRAQGWLSSLARAPLTKL